VLHPFAVVVGSAAATLAAFLVLPLMETIAQRPDADTLLRSVDTATLPPPPPPPEPEQEEEQKPQDEPPELAEPAPPLDLSQIELALNPGGVGGWMTADFDVKLGALATAQSDADALFSLADLDQKPQVIHQADPVLDAESRRKTPGAAHVLFVVDERGRVQNAIVQTSTDKVFEAPALAAVKQWKFEPGRKGGQPVRSRMRVKITFPKG
jgi:protein TonB